MTKINTSYFYNTWFESLISQKKLLGRFNDYFPKIYYSLLSRENEQIALSLEAAPEGYASTYEDLLRFVREMHELMLFPVKYNGESIYLFNYENGRYILAGHERSEKECIEFCKKLKHEYALIEKLDDSKDLMSFTGCFRNIANVIIHNRTINGNRTVNAIASFLAYTEHNPQSYNNINVQTGTIKFKKGTYQIPNWNKVIHVLKNISAYMSFFEFLQFKFVFTENGIKLWKVSPVIEVPDDYSLSTKIDDCLDLDTKYLLDEKWTTIAKEKHRSGMSSYMASLCTLAFDADKVDSNISENDRQWAHSKGYLGSRVKEINLTDDNYLNYVTDYDYYWLGNINDNYQMWFEDSLSTRYTLDNVSEKLPDYYYCISIVNGKERIIPLPDLPFNAECTYKGLFTLLKKKRKLIVKATHCSPTNGCNIIEYKSFSYYLNGNKLSRNEIINRIFNDDANYIITECIDAHKLSGNLLSKHFDTVTLHVMQHANSEPIIGSCSAKIDSSNTMVNINNSNGKLTIADAKHTIETEIPHWINILEDIRTIFKALPQFRFLSLDIIITKESFKIVNVNLFPKYSKFLMLDNDTQFFLKEIAKLKFKRYYLDLPDNYLDNPLASINAEKEKHRYKISVVVPVYNLEKYLAESLDSIINQTLSFKENIQIILVNDDSPDSSADICKEYQNRFPENIIYIHKENGGVSSARNVGLDYVQGKYVTFCDGDDIWDETAFAKVWDFIVMHEDAVDVIACRRKFFEGQTGYPGNDFRFNEGTRIINIINEPSCFHVDVNASFFKADRATAYRYNESLTLGEDSLYVNLIILEKMKYGIVKEAVLNFRKHNSGDSLTQTLAKTANTSIYTNTLAFYYEYFYDFSIEKFGEVIPYIQYLIMDAVRYRLSLPISPAIAKDIRDDYERRLINLCKRTSPEILIALRNGSVGAKANLIRLAYPELYENELTIDGKSVFIMNNILGQLNLNKALTLTSCEYTSEKTIHIIGSVLLPSFVNDPKIYLSTDDGQTVLSEAFLSKSTVGNYFAIDNKTYYDQYTFYVNIDIQNCVATDGTTLDFYLTTDTLPAKLYANKATDLNDSFHIIDGHIIL